MNRRLQWPPMAADGAACGCVASRLTIRRALGVLALLAGLLLPLPAAAQTFGQEQISDQLYLKDIAIADLTLPEATGGSGTLTYSLSPDPPDGLTFDAATRIISGAPTAVQTPAVYTYKATDSSTPPGEAELTFEIEVQTDTSPTFGAVSVDAQTFIDDVTITDLVLPAATGGNAPLTYSLGPTPALPTGLTFDAATRTISGTPSAVMTETEYTLKVTDADGNTADTDAATLTFKITVEADTSPDFSTVSVDAQTFIDGVTITDLVLPAATGGNAPLTYSLGATPALPTGLTFTADTRTIAGAPTATQTATTYTLTATDANNDTGTLTFDITVEADTAPSFGTATIADQTYTNGVAIADLLLPAATGGNAPLTYTLTPPAGLTFDADTRTVSGTPTETRAETTYTLTATDANGDSATRTFGITVNRQRPAEPANVAATGGTAQLTVSWDSSDASHPLCPVSIWQLDYRKSGSAWRGGWDVNEANPNNQDNGAFDLRVTEAGSGNPYSFLIGANTPPSTLRPKGHIGVALDGGSYEVRLRAYSNRAGCQWPQGNNPYSDYADIVSATVTAGPPTFGGATIPAQYYSQNTEIPTLNLPRASGGTLTYSLTPELPAGLDLDTNARTVTGTPTETKAETEYTWRATDGSNTADVKFNITVSADAMPSFAGEAVERQRWLRGTGLTLPLPAATGGDAPVTYSLAPALPAGVVFNAGTRIVSGTPSVTMAEATYTLTATDADGDTATLTFPAAVNFRPAAPTGLTATGGARRIAMSWSWADDTGGVCPLTRFNVYYYRPGEDDPVPRPGTATPDRGAFEVGKDVRSIEFGADDSLDREIALGDGEFQVAVQAFSLACHASRSDNHASSLYTVASVTVDPLPPDAPENLTATAGDTEVDLSWSNPNDGTITKYEVRWKASANLPFDDATDSWSDVAGSDATTTGHKVTGLANGTEYTFEVRAVNSAGDGAAASVAATPALNAPSFDNATIADQSYIENQVIADLVLPVATGGDGTLTYSLTPTLPTGLTFTPATRKIAGTPTATMDETTYTFTAADADGDTASLTFKITVATAPTTTPTSADFEVEVSKSEPHTKLVASWTNNKSVFPFKPAETRRNAHFYGVKVVTLPDTGTLKLVPTPASTALERDAIVNEVVAVSDIQSKSSERVLAFFPPDNNDNFITSFTFKVIDQIGLGTDLVESAATYTATLKFEGSTPTNAPPTLANAIADRSVTVGKDVTVELEAAGGAVFNDPDDDALTYSASSSDEARATVSVDNTANTVTVTGVAAGTAAVTVTVTANDGNGGSVQDSFTITVEADTAPSFGNATIADQSYTRNEAITALVLPEASGGNGELSYTLTPTLPNGLTFTPPSGTTPGSISGMPTAVQAATDYSWTVTDRDDDTASLTFKITVAAAPTSANFTKEVFRPHTKLVASRGSSNVFPFTPADEDDSGALFREVQVVTLPNLGKLKTVPATPKSRATERDVSANQKIPVLDTQQSRYERVLAFFPPDNNNSFNTSFTFKVIDENRVASAATYTATLKFEGSTLNRVPNLNTSSVAPQTFTVGETVDRKFLWSNTGDGKLIYTLTPALPAGLAYDGDGPDGSGVGLGDANAPHLTGTPVQVTAAEEYTLTVADTDNVTGAADEDKVTFDIEVVASETPLTAPANLAAAPGTNAGEVDLSWDAIDIASKWQVRHAEGTSVPRTVAWTDVPNSNATTTGHTVTGLANGTEYTFEVRAVNANNGPAGEVSLTLAGLVVSPTSLRIEANASGDFTVALSTAPSAAVTVAVTSDDTDITVSPDSLDFTTADYATAKTVTVNMAENPADGAATIALSATGGDYAGLGASVSVSLNAVPSFGIETIADQSYIENLKIEDLVLPVATGGDGTLTYTLTPAEADRPAGLVFTLPSGTTAGLISGTPSEAKAQATYTLKARDLDGDEATLTFAITVEADGSPSFSQTIADQSYIENLEIADLALPVATGGNGTLTYTLTPDPDDRPAGLVFTLPLGTTPGSISGTPSEAKAQATYTLKARDLDGDEATLTFAITVEADSSPAFSQTIADQSYIENLEIADLTLPVATGGNGTLTYTLTPAEADRPAGLVFTLPSGTTAGSISGTPSEAKAQATYTLKARDLDGDEATLTFAITVEADGSPSFSQTIADQSYIENLEIADLALPVATGGNGTLTYTLTPDPDDRPAGLVFTLPLGTTPGSISGTPSEAKAQATYTLKARDLDGDEATLTFAITVEADSSPAFNQTIADQSYIENLEIADLTLPVATGGNGTLTYTLTPAEADRPAGLVFTLPSGTTAGSISGTPSEAKAQATYTLKARDLDGDEATLTFAITVEADGSPSFSQTIADQSYIENLEIADLALPVATGGNGTLTYTLTPDPDDRPAGLVFTLPLGTTPGSISGTPSEAKAQATYTLKARDLDGDEATLTFAITVEADSSPAFSQMIADQSYIENLEIADLTLPVATGGNGTLTYTLAPAEADRPAGLVFTLPLGTTAGSISGTPSEAKAQATYTLKARDLDDDEATLTFAITVEADTAPSFGNATIADQSYIENQAITALVLPEATGGNGTLSYTVTPTLPTGLAFAPATRTITGAATVTQTATTYTLKARDQDGDEATLTFTITVNADVPPSFGSATIAAQSYIENQAITALVLPEATGGNGALSYSLNPAPPAGLTFTPPSGTTPGSISGTPTATMDETTYTFTATDADTNTDASDQATLTFTITVAAAPTFSQTIADQNWFRTYRIEDVQLPAASGGNGALSYTLTPALPDGLTFNARARTISGTPTTATPTTTYTLTATDSSTSPAKAELTFRGVVGFTPAAPTNVTAEGGSRRITVRWNWQDDTGGVCPALDFGLYYLRPDADLPNCDDPNTGDVGCFLVVADSNNTDYTFTFGADHSLDEYIALGDGKFEIWLTAYSRECEETKEFPSNTPWSQYFHPIPDVTVLPGPPAEPTGLAATPGDRQVTLAWNNPNDSTITKYQLRWKASASLPFDDATDSWSDVTGSGATTTGHTVTGLANGTEYTFEVRAVNGDGGGAAASVAATPEGIPAAPIDLKAAAGDTQVTLNWKLPTNAGKIDRVELRWKASASLPFVDATDSWTDLNDATATTYKVTGLTNGTGYTFQVRAANSAGDGAAASVAATPNAPPTVANEITDRTVTIGAPVIIALEDANNPVFTDPDGDALTYSASSGDTDKATVTYDSGAESITVSGVASSGTDTVTITVTADDGNGGSVSDEFAVTVNAPPTVANEIADRTLNVSATVTIQLEDANNPVFTDPDDSSLTYTASSGDTDKATVTYDSGAESITVTGVASSGTDTVTITVTADDGNGGSVSDEFAVTVNAPPTVANEIADRTLNVSATATIQLEDANNPVFTDPDDSSLTYTASSGDTDKATVAYNSGAESITVTGVASSGTDTVTITVTASDGRGGSVSDEFTVTVTAQNPTNNDPTVANEIADRIVTIGAPVIIALEDANNPVFTDPDGDALTYSASSGDTDKATVTYDSGAESITVSGVASSGTDTVTITVTADDGNGGSVSDEFAVTVNAPPTVANEIADRTLNVSATVTIQLEDANNPVFTDPDDSSLTYTASSGDTDKATVTYNSGAESITVTGVASSGTDTVTITVTADDGNGGSVSDEFAVTVNAPPTVANEIADRTLNVSATVTIQLEDANNPVFTDPDDSSLTYTASSGDTDKATVTYDSGAESITVSGVASSGTDTVTITVTASDGRGGSVSDEFAVTVNAPPTVANEIADRTLNVSATVTIQLEDANNPVFTDPDDSSLTYTASSGDTDKATVVYNSGAESITVTGVASSGTDTVTITVTASDGRGGSVSDEFAVTVTAQNPTNNDPTVANEIADRIVTIGAPVIIALEDANNPVFTDPDGDALTYSASSGDTDKATVTYDSGAESITVSGVASSGTDTVTITVTADDGNGGSVSDEFAVTVNAPPTVANEIADRTLNVSATVTIQLEDANNPVFTDPDDSSLTYTASSGDTDKATVTYNSGAESITVTGVASSGTDTVTITVTADDGNGGSVSDEFAVTVNAPPTVANEIADRTLNVSATVTIQLEDANNPVFTDPDDSSLTYTASSGDTDKATVAYNSGAESITVTGVASSGTDTVTITVTASDGRGGSVSDEFTVTVTAQNPTNNDPTVANEIADRIVTIGAPVIIALEDTNNPVFTDPDGDALTYTASSGDTDKATVTYDSGAESITVTGVASSGTDTVTITVTADDGNGGSVSDEFAVTVNAPPTVANEIADRTLNVSATVTIQLEDANNPVFTDPDDSSLTYTASSGDTDKATVVYNSGAESITVTGVASSGTDTVTITVTADDGNGGSVSDEFAVTVNAPPTVANEIADRTLNVSATVTIQLEDANNPVFTDPDDSSLTYTASSGDTDKATVAYNSGAESITVTGVASSGTDTVTITVTASDGRGGSVSDEFAVTVTAQNPTNNDPTVANEIADRIVTIGAPVIIALEDANNPVFTDPDGDALTYSASSGDTDKATVTYDSGAESITVSGVASSGTDTVTITVTADDGNGGSVSDEFAVTVNAPPTVANEIADRTLNVSATVTIQLEDANNPVFTDPDDSSLTYTASSGDTDKATVTYNSGAESITVTGVASSGTDTVTITVTADDGNGGSVSDEFAVTVNAPPTVANEIADRTLNVSATVTIQLEDANNPVFTDPDDSSLTYTASSGDTDKATVAYNSGAESITVTGVASSGTDTVTITVTASDGRGGSVSDEFAVTVTAQNPTNNDPTVANEIADRIVTIGAPVIIALEDANNPVFTDPDGDDLSYEVSSSDATKATVTYDSGAESITVTGVASSRTDTVTITVTADDGNGGSVSDEFAVTVNAPPTVANEIADRTLNVSATVTIQLEDANNPVFTDPDDSSLTYTASSGDTDKATVAYNSGAESITVTGVASSGTDTVTITVTASDGRGGSVSDEFAVTVTAQNPTNNDPTVANEIADRIVTIGAPVIIALEDANNPVFTDPDGDDLSYEVSSSDATKATVTYDSGAESITVTGVASSRTDTVTITVTADDGNGGSVSDEFAVTVNAPPTVANEIADRTLNVSATVTIQLEDANNPVFTDPDDSSLTYTASSGDTDKATVAYNSGAESITVTGVASSGTDTVTITVTASDGRGGSVSDQFTVTVTAQNPTNNDPTVANEIADRIVTIGAPVIIALEDANNPVFTDPDGDALTYSASSSDATKATVTYDSGAESITVSGVASSGTDTVTITVTADDGNGGSVSDEFAVTVNAPPTVANEIADRTLNVSATATIQLEDANNPVFTDPDDSSLTYTASSGDTDKATVAYNSGAESITVTGVASSGTDTVTITVTASDGRGGSVSNQFTVTVTADDAPSFGNAAIADQTYSDGVTITDLTLPVATGGNGTLTYTLTPEPSDRPAGLVFTLPSGTTPGSISGTPTETKAEATYTLTATDRDGDADTLTFTITVTAPGSVNNPPTVVRPIGNRIVNVGATLTIRLERSGSAVFNDADGHSLSYRVVSNAADKATARIAAGNNVVITGVAAGTATVTVTADDGNGGSVSDSFTVTVTATEGQTAGLTEPFIGIGRATLRSAMDLTEWRSDTGPGDPSIRLAGERIDPAPRLAQASGPRWIARPEKNSRARSARKLDPEELLLQSSLGLSLGDGGGADWSVWGRGDVQRFRGGAGALRHVGKVETGWLGLDARFDDDLLAGMTVARSTSRVTLNLDGDESHLETALTAAYPYLLAQRPGGGGWRLIAGAGSGEAELLRPNTPVERADLSLRLASVGGRWPVATSDGFQLAVSGDAGMARLETRDATGRALSRLEATVWQLRGGLEAEHDGLALPDSTLLLTPSGSLVLRHDGGDGATGTGVEVALGLRLAAPGARFGLDASGHWLALHSTDDYRSFGGAIEARLAPDAQGRGLSFSIGPQWGARQTGLLELGDVFHGETEHAPDHRSLSARTHYGFRVGRDLLSPFVTMELGEFWRRYETGVEARLADGVNATLAGERQIGDSDAETVIRLNLGVRF